MNITSEAYQETVTLGTPLEGEAFAIKGDAAFFDILSNSLYSNPYLAVVRETLTNALDAHQEAKVQEPVEITYKPSEGLFIVKDKGYGIPHQQIHSIYCTYGSSTKRDTDSTGGFGLGCKSPFAITNSFSIIDCCEGIKRTYVFAKNKGIPEILRIEGEEQTTETGLTVIIPVKKSNLLPMITAYAFYSGGSFKLNGEHLKTVKYQGTGVYYVDSSLPYHLSELGVHSYYGTDFTVLYGTNVYNLYSHDLEKDSGLQSILDQWHSLAVGIKSSAVAVGGNNLRYFTNAIVKVAPNSIDITPNREDIRYTPKTIATLKQMFTKEIKRLTGGINLPKWKSLYANHRLNALTQTDFIYNTIKGNYYITTKDINCQKYDSNCKHTNVFTLLNSDNSNNLFNSDELEYISFLTNNLEQFKQDASSSKYSSEILTQGVNLINAIESPLKETLKKYSINTFSYDFDNCTIKPLTKEEICNSLRGAYYYEDYLFNKLYKVVILSNYKSYDARSPLTTLVETKYPQFHAEALLKYAYRVSLQSVTKASSIETELTQKGYYVINLVQERERKPVSMPKSMEILEALTDKNKAYYVTNASKYQLMWLESYDHSAPLFTLFTTNKYPYEVRLDLPRYSSYEEVPVTNKNFVSVFQRNGLKSLEETVCLDVKEILDNDPALKEAMSLILFGTKLSSNETTNNQLIRIFWFIYQIPEYCERYGLPQLSQKELKKLCFLNSFINSFDEFKEQFAEILTPTEKVQKILDNIKELMTFNQQYASLIAFAYEALVKLQPRGYEDQSRVSSLVTSILDSFLLETR